MIGSKSSSYKWYVLTLVSLTMFFCSGTIRFCMPVLFKEISEDLDLSIVKIGAIWGMESVAGIFVSFLIGPLVDRFGIKRTVSVLTLLIGVMGSLRGISAGFISLMTAMFFFGLLSTTFPTVIPKVIALWFKDRYLGLANGIFTMWAFGGAMIITMISATVLSPLLGGWKNVLLLSGLPPMVICILWLMTYRENGRPHYSEINENKISYHQALSRVIQIKQVWIIGIFQMCCFGVYIGVSGYLPIYLRGIGWSIAYADGATTAYVGAIGVFTIPISLLSDLWGSRKRLLLPILIIVSVTLFVIPMSNGVALWVFIILNGMMVGGIIPITLAMTIEAKRVGTTYAGTALGIVSSLGFLGGSIFPPFGNSMAHIHSGLPFTLWGGMTGILLLSFFFLKDR